jgi:tetratricopeptide (TPR) repeat protein
LSGSGEVPALRGDGRPSALIKKLQALGLRGYAMDACALLGGPPRGAQRLDAALADIERLEAEGGPTAWSLALKGRLLFLLRRTGLARAEFDLAVGMDPSLLEARLWRAQAALALRDADGALSDLDALAAARRPSGWEDYLRGLSLMMLGRALEATPVLRAAARRGVGARASAILALALAEQRRFKQALTLLAAAKGKPGSEGVPLGAFEGMILRQSGDLEGSLRALIRAGRGPRPYPWVFSHRADVHNRMGFYQQALVDLKRFHELLPREASAFAQAANVLYDQAYYDEALKAIKAASALAPRDADLQARRAQILVSAGRIAEAARVLRSALRLAPDDIHLREELIEAAVMAGQAALARVEISRGGLSRTPFGRIMLGVLLAREGRWGAARASFTAAAAGVERGEPLRDRALFYGAIARVLTRRGARPGPGLSLCGVGVRHPFQLSVETLRALAASRTIFTNLPDIEARRFLALFSGRVVSVPRRPDQTNRDRARWVVRRLRAGEAAAFLTRIHPFIYRRMGWELLQMCRAKGVAVTAYGAVSLTELAGCRAVEGGAPADADAVRVFDIAWLNRHPELLRPADPTVIYCIGDDKERPRLVRLLRRSHQASGGAYLLGGSGDREDVAPWVAWRKLGLSLRLGDIGCVLYIPAARSKRAPLKTGGAPLVRLHGLGTRVPEETTLETLAALSDAPAAFVAVGAGASWRRLRALCPGLRRAGSPGAVIAAARRHGEAVVAVPGGVLFDGGFAARLIDACRRSGVGVRITPSVSPVGSSYARAQFCLGGDYGYQGIAACSARRLLAEPDIHTPLIPLVVYGVAGTRLILPEVAPAVPDP